MAFIDCNFAKCALREITSNHCLKNGKLPSGAELKRVQEFNLLFSDVPDLTFKVDFSSTSKDFHYINKKVKELLCKFNVRHWNKEEFLETFCQKKWKKLSLAKKRTHSLRGCKGCYADFPHITFPWKTRKFPNRNPLLNLHVPVPAATSTQPNQISPEGITRLATKVYNEVNDGFVKVTGKSFGEVLPAVKAANVTRKLSKYERQKDLDSVRKTVKRKLESELHAVDESRPFQYRESLSMYEKITRNEFLTSGEKPKKIRRIQNSRRVRHASRTPNYNISSVIEDLENVEIGTSINWEQLAKKHGVTSKNAGQTIKEHLRDKHVDISQYANFRKRKTNLEYSRRCKRRLFGGRITAPSHLTKAKVRAEMKRKIENGQFDIGEPCVPTEVKKPKLKENSIEWESVKVNGRKIPLINIRNNMLKEHEGLGIMKIRRDQDYEDMDRAAITLRLHTINQQFFENQTTEELRSLLQNCERTRHLKMWHDHSIIENRGHMLFVVSAVYDTALYYTNEEFRELHGYHLDVETVVEQPWVYIIGMSGDSCSDQFAYIDARTSDLLDMNNAVSTSNGVSITDVMRFHHGDHPALQFEFGVSQGGEYCCVGCPVSARMFGDLAHCLRQPIRTVEEILKTATAGPHGRFPGMRKPIRSLKKHELVEELDARGLPTAGNCDQLRESLKSVRCGVESVPALLINTPDLSLADVNLSQLEPVLTEGLHDCKGHIENVLTELECYKDHGDVAAAVKELKDSLFGNNDKIRGKDYRQAAYLLPEFLSSRGSPERYIDLAKSLREICGLLYMRSVQRTMKSVLRLYNQVLLHAILIREILGDPKKITKRKLFGVYFHGLVHAALLNRILPPRSGNAEFQEAEFHSLREISKRTSNHHADTAIPNMLLRRQAEKSVKGPTTSVTVEDSDKCQFGVGNSVIQRLWLKQYPTLIQAHCENIADFLELGPGAWWSQTSDGDIQFHDSLGPTSTDDVTPSQPCLSHFRSSTQAKEKKRLQLKWESILERGVQLPLEKVRVYDKDGELMRIDRAGEGDLVFQTPVLDSEECEVEGIQFRDLMDPTTTTPTPGAAAELMGVMSLQ